MCAPRFVTLCGKMENHCRASILSSYEFETKPKQIKHLILWLELASFYIPYKRKQFWFEFILMR